jgi:hypothetical protein
MCVSTSASTAEMLALVIGIDPRQAGVDIGVDSRDLGVQTRVGIRNADVDIRIDSFPPQYPHR